MDSVRSPSLGLRHYHLLFIQHFWCWQERELHLLLLDYSFDATDARVSIVLHVCLILVVDRDLLYLFVP